MRPLRIEPYRPNLSILNQPYILDSKIKTDFVSDNIFTVAPTGSTNLDITLGIPFFSSIHLNVIGSVAALYL